VSLRPAPALQFCENLTLIDFRISLAPETLTIPDRARTPQARILTASKSLSNAYAASPRAPLWRNRPEAPRTGTTRPEGCENRNAFKSRKNPRCENLNHPEILKI
jgi:hypothetical protein